MHICIHVQRGVTVKHLTWQSHRLVWWPKLTKMEAILLPSFIHIMADKRSNETQEQHVYVGKGDVYDVDAPI